MTVYKEQISVESHGNTPTYINITPSYLPGGDRTAIWNCDAHIKATLIGASEVFDVDDGALGVGKTGYIYFADFDRARPRVRQCKIVVMGE